MKMSNSTEKKRLLLLALLSIALDVGTSLAELPFLGFLPVSIGSEELTELLISTLLAGDRLKLTWSDRMIGLLPIPGITAISVRVLKELIQKTR